ncbi:hypothetical protein Tsubulata_034040 [Turnera subulata]|uniref:Uncharacterized protein n=1 Tax=Turnera subulata TaxID=218843 RepID=A0A9Q0FHD0_9ROSI|nr:hypothetical protein Tsubulata_034040 [Turnera subulata]
MTELGREENPEIDAVEEERVTREDDGSGDPPHLEKEENPEMVMAVEEGATSEDGDFDHPSSEHLHAAAYLGELNLVIMVLSLLSEDCLEGDEEKQVRSFKDYEAKVKASRTLQPRKREIHQGKFPGGQAHRLQAMVKDCR